MPKKLNRIFGTIIIVFMLFVVIDALYKRQQLDKNYRFANGEITEITLPGWKAGGNYSILYKYMVNNSVHHGNQEQNYCGDLSLSKIRSILVGKHFPVAYSVKSPSAAVLVLTSDKVNRFSNIKAPDSLRLYDSILTCK